MLQFCMHALSPSAERALLFFSADAETERHASACAFSVEPFFILNICETYQECVSTIMPISGFSFEKRNCVRANTKHDETVYHSHRGLRYDAYFAIYRKQITCSKFLVCFLQIEMIVLECRKQCGDKVINKERRHICFGVSLCFRY